MSMGEIAVRHCPIHGQYTYDMFNGTKEGHICPKCKVERVSKSMKNELQKAIDQIGAEAVQKSIPVGAKICNCDLHGMYMVAPGVEPTCPICPPVPEPNGTTATEVEHYISIKDAISPASGTNPQQKANPLGI